MPLIDDLGILEQPKQSGLIDDLGIFEKQSQDIDFESIISNVQKPMVNLKNVIAGIKTPNISQEQLPEWAKKHPNLYQAASKAYEVSKPTLEMGGSLVGGAVGSGGNPLNVGGMLVGSGVGFSGVKALERNIESKLYGRELPSPVQSLTQTSKDIATGIVYEGTGQLASKFLDFITRPMSRSLKAKSLEIMKQSKELGISPNPADVNPDATSLAQLESLFSRLFGSGHVMRKNDLENVAQLKYLYEKVLSEKDHVAVEELGDRLKNQIVKFLEQSDNVTAKNIKQWGDDVLKVIGAKDTFESLGSKVKTGLDAEKEILYNLKNSLYEQVDDMIPEDAITPATNIRNTASEWLRRFENNPVIDKGILDDLAKISEGESGYNWNTLEDIRRIMRDSADNANMLSQGTGVSGKGMVKQGENYTSLVYRSLREAAEKDQQEFINSFPEGNQVKELFKQAKSISGEMKQKFTNPEMLKIIKANPEDVVNAAFKPRGITEINSLKNALGKEKFDNLIQPMISNKLMGTDNLELYDPKYFDKQIDKYGKEVIDAVYGKGGYQSLKNVAKYGMDIISMPIATKTERTFLEKLVKTDNAKALVESIFTSGESKYLARNFDYVLKVADEPTKKALEYNLIIELFTKNQDIDPNTISSTQKELVTFSTKKFKKAMLQYEDVLGRIFKPEDITLFRKIANVGEYLKSAERISANPSGTAGGVGQMGQMAATTSYLLSGKIGKAIGVVGIPTGVARLYMSPLGRKYMTEGFEVSATSLKGMDLITKMSLIATQPNEMEDK